MGVREDAGGTGRAKMIEDEEMLMTVGAICLAIIALGMSVFGLVVTFA